MTLPRLAKSFSKPLGLALLASSVVGSAFAAPLTPEEALERAIKRSPELRAALAELKCARLGVLGQDRARDWVLRASLQGQYAEQFSDTSEGGVLNSNQVLSGDVSVTTTTDIGTVINVGLGSSSLRWSAAARSHRPSVGHRAFDPAV